MASIFVTADKAAINGESCLTNIVLEIKEEPASGYCSSSRGGIVLASGNKDWNGWARAYAVPTKLPGDTFTLTTSAAGGVEGYSGSAISTKMQVVWPVEQAQLIFYKYFFAAESGALTHSGTATDVGSPAPKSAISRAITFGSSYNIRYGVLEIENIPAVFNDSGTNGNTERVKGNYKAHMMFNMYCKVAGGGPALGTEAVLTVPISDTANIIITKMRLVGLGPIFEIESKDGRSQGVARDMELEWNAYDGGVAGSIVIGSTTIWP